LLLSRSRRFPDGLGNESGVLGHYLMDSVAVWGGARTVPALDGVPGTRAFRPAQAYIPRFRNVGPERSTFLRGYGVQVSSAMALYGDALAAPGFGAPLQAALRKQTPRWFIAGFVFGECLPQYANACRLDPELKDAWGLPTLRVEMSFGENE